MMANDDDSNWIVPPFATSGVQRLCDEAGRAIQNLVRACPRDQSALIEITHFLNDQQEQVNKYFWDTPS